MPSWEKCSHVGMFTTWALILPAPDVDSDPHPCLRNVSAVPNIQLEVTCNKKKKLANANRTCESWWLSDLLGRLLTAFMLLPWNKNCRWIPPMLFEVFPQDSEASGVLTSCIGWIGYMHFRTGMFVPLEGAAGGCRWGVPLEGAAREVCAFGAGLRVLPLQGAAVRVAYAFRGAAWGYSC